MVLRTNTGNRKDTRRTPSTPATPNRAPRIVLPRRANRDFTSRIAVLGVLIVALWWVGWKSPWGRADARVRVEAGDAPQPAAAPPAATAVSPAVSGGTNERSAASRTARHPASTEGHSAAGDTTAAKEQAHD